MSPLESARQVAANPQHLEKRLRSSAACLVSPLRPLFTRAAPFDPATRSLTSTDGRYRLVWKLRDKPDQPIDHDNQQTSIGICRVEVVHASLGAHA